MKKRGYYLSRIFMFGFFVLVVIAVALTYMQQTSKYFPILLIGLIGGCASTPFYYYFKAKAKTVEPYWGTDVKALNDYAQMGKKKSASPK